MAVPLTANLAVEEITNRPNPESRNARKQQPTTGFLAKSNTCSGQITAMVQSLPNSSRATNGHIHLWQTALRGVAADWTLDHYFGMLIGQVVKLYAPEDVYIGNLIGALDQINSGVTTLFDWCHIVNTPTHADAAVDALRDAGIRAIFAYGTPMTLFGTTEPHPVDARRCVAND
jgi:hypothetical protein